MQIPLRRGRAIEDTDTRDRPLVAVVSESFAKRHWPNEDAIGRTFQTRGQVWSVVGVVGDVKVRGPERSSEPQLYIPFDQAPQPTGELYTAKDLLVRSSRPLGALLPSIREIVRQVDPQQPISNVRMLSDVIDDQTSTRRAQVRILSALAALALLLAGVGINGLLAFTVAQRDREIGVRLALGADPKRVAGMIVSEAMKMAVIGVVPGVLIAYGAARAMAALLFGVRPDDPLTIAVATGACFVTTVVACARPALRAARIDPMSALRAE
jgi:hypothetical protein